MVIKLRCELAQRRETRPRDEREVVVFVVVSHVPRQHVEGSVVAVRLGGRSDENVMLSDEVSGARVEGTRAEGGSQEVPNRSRAVGLVDRDVEGNGRHEVEEVVPPPRLRAHDPRP